MRHYSGVQRRQQQARDLRLRCETGNGVNDHAKDRVTQPTKERAEDNFRRDLQKEQRLCILVTEHQVL